MTLLIDLPKSTEENLREAARKQRLSPERLAAQILEDALAPDPFPTLEEVVAKIKALPTKPENVRPAVGSLQELLASDPEDAEFDLESWQEEWDRVEAEMKAITRANSIAEGFDPLP
jgi:hypothetical protein